MSPPPRNVYVYFCQWIKNPHDKIALCVCDKKVWCFWFNSEASFHGIAQLPVKVGEHTAITKDCFLDLSEIKGLSDIELQSAKDRGPVSDALKKRIIEMLKQPIKTLPQGQRMLALKNFQE